jgi:hypothetical protein
MKSNVPESIRRKSFESNKGCGLRILFQKGIVHKVHGYFLLICREMSLVRKIGILPIFPT